MLAHLSLDFASQLVACVARELYVCSHIQLYDVTLYVGIIIGDGTCHHITHHFTCITCFTCITNINTQQTDNTHMLTIPFFATHTS